jgi:hypothetical protein
MVVMSNTSSLQGEVVGDYGWVTGGANDAWDVLWSKGAFVAGMANANLAEVSLPFKSNDVLGRQVIPERSCDPDMAGVVVLQSAGNLLVVESAARTWVAGKGNVRTI